jgi:hypothetical protein
MDLLGIRAMKTWKFTAEILWLFLGLCACPQSTDRTRDVKQRDFHPIIGDQENLMEQWYSSALIRPPPPGQ